MASLRRTAGVPDHEDLAGLLQWGPQEMRNRVLN